MHILIFGSNGQLGSEWVRFLENHSLKTITFRSYTSSELDITQSDDLKSVIAEESPSVIINCAAYTSVDRAEDEMHVAELVNGKAVGWIAEMCEANQIKLIHYSTDYIFAGKPEDKVKYPKGYPEDHPASPVNWYGKTKWMGEQLIRKFKTDHLIIRTSWLCGAFGTNFVTKMLSLAAKNENIDVVDDQYGSPSYTRNIVENTVNLMQSDRSGTYHVTSSGIISWYQFAERIFRQRGIDVNLRPVSSGHFPTRARRPVYSKLSNDKLQKVKGSKIITWKEGLHQLLTELEKMN